MRGLLVAFVILYLAQFNLATISSDIASTARQHIDSKRWLFTAYHEVGGRNTNKCNLFVADVLRDVGASAPNRGWWWYRPIGANEWGDANSKYLTESDCWKRCTGGMKEGDVIAIFNHHGSGHVGIVTGNGKTTSASAAAKPAGLVVENDWGFRSGQNPTCWRFSC